MRGRIAHHAEVRTAANDAPAKVVLPDAVHGDACRKGIAGRSQPLGELAAAAVTVGDFGSLAICQHRDEAPRHSLAGLVDLATILFLGVFQLGLPCMLMVRAAIHLPPYEVALLGLLEVVLGPIWAWLWAGEQPGAATLQGGALVLSALLATELLAQRERR